MIFFALFWAPFFVGVAWWMNMSKFLVFALFEFLHFTGGPFFLAHFGYQWRFGQFERTSEL